MHSHPLKTNHIKNLIIEKEKGIKTTQSRRIRISMKTEGSSEVYNKCDDNRLSTLEKKSKRNALVPMYAYEHIIENEL